MGLILISHDLNLVASFCDRVLIMYAGRVVETCAAARCTTRAIPTRAACSPPCRRSTAPRAAAGPRRDPAWLDGQLADT